MKTITDQLNRIERQQHRVDARIARAERLLDLLVWATTQETSSIMALKATDDLMITEVHRTTDTAAAAVLALNTLTGNVADLTSRLAAAIANSGASDDAAVQAALVELRSANDRTVAATPVLGGAIANTDPNKPPPVVQL